MSAEVIGLEVADLPEGWIPVEAITVVKCLADDGSSGSCIRRTEGLGEMDAIGMLSTALDIAKRDVLEGWEADGDD